MTLDDILARLNKNGILLEFTQYDDGYGVRVRKKGSTMAGFATAKKVKDAVSQALGKMRDSFDPKNPDTVGWPKPIQGLYSPSKAKPEKTAKAKKGKRTRL